MSLHSFWLIFEPAESLTRPVDIAMVLLSGVGELRDGQHGVVRRKEEMLYVFKDNLYCRVIPV